MGIHRACNKHRINQNNMFVDFSMICTDMLYIAILYIALLNICTYFASCVTTIVAKSFISSHGYHVLEAYNVFPLTLLRVRQTILIRTLFLKTCWTTIRCNHSLWGGWLANQVKRQTDGKKLWKCCSGCWRAVHNPMSLHAHRSSALAAVKGTGSKHWLCSTA